MRSLPSHHLFRNNFPQFLSQLRPYLQFFAEHHRRVRKHDSEDFAQELICRLLTHDRMRSRLAKIEERKFPGYLRALINNASNELYNKQKTSRARSADLDDAKDIPSNEEDPLALLLSHEESKLSDRRVQKIRSQLTPQELQLVELKMEKVSAKWIAQHLGTTQNAVDQRWSRLRTRLRLLLKQDQAS